MVGFGHDDGSMHSGTEEVFIINVVKAPTTTQSKLSSDTSTVVSIVAVSQIQIQARSAKLLSH